MEVGTDIVKISRIKSIKNQDRFLSKNFAENEIEYINKKNGQAQTIAGMFACKEAVLKALGIGISGGVRLNEICILHEPNGRPFVQITSQLNYFLNLKNCNTISVSISHDGDYAVAFCIIC
ncbi:MAG: holo-ACP synthase [Christensenellales bacterium]